MFSFSAIFWDVQAKKKTRHRILCAKLPDGHLKFECSVLHSNVDFYFKFDEYAKFLFFLTALMSTIVCPQEWDMKSIPATTNCARNWEGCPSNSWGISMGCFFGSGWCPGKC